MNAHKLSYSMRRVLRALAEGRPACGHCRTRSDYGGLAATLMALRRRGLVRRNEIRLTLAGRRAAIHATPNARESR